MAAHAAPANNVKEIVARASAIFHYMRGGKPPVFNTIGAHGIVTPAARSRAREAIAIEAALYAAQNPRKR